MRLFVNVKQAGSRRNYITKEEISLENKPLTLRQLIGMIVTYNVKKFNNKVKDQTLINYLTSEEINDKASIGKVSFGELNNNTEADLNKALECAYLAYEDGIYRVFIGEGEAGGLDENLDINEDEVLTFIRLTMLSGRLW